MCRPKKNEEIVEFLVGIAMKGPQSGSGQNRGSEDRAVSGSGRHKPWGRVHMDHPFIPHVHPVVLVPCGFEYAWGSIKSVMMVKHHQSEIVASKFRLLRSGTAPIGRYRRYYIVHRYMVHQSIVTRSIVT